MNLIFSIFIYTYIFSGADHLKLIFEYAEWVLKEHPEDGLKVETHKKNDTAKSYEFIEKCCLV